MKNTNYSLIGFIAMSTCTFLFCNNFADQVLPPEPQPFLAKDLGFVPMPQRWAPGTGQPASSHGSWRWGPSRLPGSGYSCHYCCSVAALTITTTSPSPGPSLGVRSQAVWLFGTPTAHCSPVHRSMWTRAFSHISSTHVHVPLSNQT